MKVQLFVKNEYNRYLRLIRQYVVAHSSYEEFREFVNYIVSDFAELLKRFKLCCHKQELEYLKKLNYETMLQNNIDFLVKKYYASEAQ